MALNFVRGRALQGEMPARLQFFKQSFELKIKGELIPEAASEEIIGEPHSLFARHNAIGHESEIREIIQRICAYFSTVWGTCRIPGGRRLRGGKRN